MFLGILGNSNPNPSSSSYESLIIFKMFISVLGLLLKSNLFLSSLCIVIQFSQVQTCIVRKINFTNAVSQ